MTVAAESSASGCTSQNRRHRDGHADGDAGEQPPAAVHHRQHAADRRRAPRPSSSPRATTTVTRPAGRRSRPASTSAMNSDAVPPKRWLTPAPRPPARRRPRRGAARRPATARSSVRHGVGAGGAAPLIRAPAPAQPPTTQPGTEAGGDVERVVRTDVHAPEHDQQWHGERVPPPSRPGSTSTTTQVTAATRMTWPDGKLGPVAGTSPPRRTGARLARARALPHRQVPGHAVAQHPLGDAA